MHTLFEPATAEVEVAVEERNEAQENSAATGLARIAFGKINDAVRLLTGAQELDDITVSRLDLFAVSEIRRNKDGGLDVKFYDRLKALELLLDLQERTEPAAASSFFGALESAAKSASDSDAI